MEERKVDLRLAGGREVEPKPQPAKPSRKKSR
jgi:hypothetical protein